MEEGYRHTYTTIPLISEEEFLEAHPEHADKSPHELMKHRLQNERVVREELEAQRKLLVIKKQKLIAENKKRKDDLASLDEQLKKFIEVCSFLLVIYGKEHSWKYRV